MKHEVYLRELVIPLKYFIHAPSINYNGEMVFISPYRTEIESEIKTISPLCEFVQIKKWERGDYLVYFSEKTGYPIGRVGTKLKGMQDIRTLAYIRSVCEKNLLEGRKTSFRHAFNSALFVPKVGDKLFH